MGGAEKEAKRERGRDMVGGRERGAGRREGQRQREAKREKENAPLSLCILPLLVNGYFSLGCVCR